MKRHILAAITMLAAWTTGAQAQFFPFHDPGQQVIPLMGQSESYLGVYLSEVTPELVDQLSLSEEAGAHVNQVMMGTPAEAAGLETDDIIVRWNGQRIESARQFTRIVRETPPGRTATVEVVRKGENLSIDVVVGTRDPNSPPSFRPPPFDRQDDEHEVIPFEEWHPPIFGRPAPPRVRLGVIMQPLTEQLATYFGLDDRLGALVTTVMKETPAQDAGLKAGDVLLSVNGTSIESPRDVQRTVRDADTNTLEIEYLRDKETQSISISLAPPEEASDEASDEMSDPETFPPDSL